MIILPQTNFGSEVASITEVGRRFSDYGSYTDAPYMTEEWMIFWKEQQRRSLAGYQVGDLKVTGDHYFYLNFVPILRSNIKVGEEISSSIVTVDEVKAFPDFWDYDWQFFNCKSRARREGKNLIVLKARRKGYSYKIASILVKAYSLIPYSKGFAFAEMKEYLLGDGFLTKAFLALNFIDSHTAFQQPRLNDKEMMKRSGFRRNINGTDVEQGNLSEIHGITIGDDPDKARGKAGLHGIFEEAGKFKGLKKTWNVASSSYQKGRFKTGMMMAFGTGGSEDSDFEDLSEMFYDPDAYNVLAFNNVWDEAATGNKCCFFVPAYVTVEGFIDQYGNSDVEEAKKFHEAEREVKKAAKDPKALAQEISEHPFTPREATLVTDSNIFPIAELDAHLNLVNSRRLERQAVFGRLYKDEKEIKFKPTAEHPPIYKFPHEESMDLTGCITMTEPPYRPDGKAPPDNLYVIVHDPYAKDQTKEGGSRMSLGAAYVIKGVSSESPSLNTCIVASYVGRPKTQDEYNYNLFLLAEYYNAKIGFENNRGNVIQYAKKEKKLQYLKPELDILDKRQKLRPGNRTSITYGITTNSQVKSQGEIYLRDWLLEPVKITEDGEEKLRLHYIIDPALLNELIKFNWEGNFDRVMALLVGMFYIEDRKVRGKPRSPEVKKKLAEFFDREIYA